ncbi:DUF3822 family protein [Daejeonella sp.]|uniref:DUF3822 family protein n=1 Tax=Daejeonella sp. TaxID=2805397 RepID=UPI00398393A5
MNKLLYLSDDEIQSQLAAKYDLLVHIGLDTLQYAIIDSIKQETKVLAEFEIPTLATTTELIKAVEELPESNRQFRYTFNKVKVSFTTLNYTFIPAPLYLESDHQDYGKYLNLDNNGELLVNTISSAEIKNVLAIPSEFKTALQKIFQKPSIYSQATAFLEGIQSGLRREDELVFFLDIQPKHFQIALFKDLRLEFYNTFEYANTDEFNFYLLNVIQSLEIHLDDTRVMLSGKITEQDEIYQRIEKYFENIHFIDSELLVKYSGKFEKVFPHTYSTLFSLDLCE